MEEVVKINPAMKTVTNTDEAEFEKRVSDWKEQDKLRRLEAERSDNCPVCGARKERERLVTRWNTDIISLLHNVSIASLDSCIICVQKHVSRALVYYEEMLTAKDSGKIDGEAAVNLEINHLKVLGHLGCAIEESTDYADLHDLLIKYERAYRYEAISPDWQKLAAEILKVKNTLTESKEN